ncbi:MAG TPA: potassium channel family protein [Bryobacteraceae bacterium]|jgi:hypothetical protein
MYIVAGLAAIFLIVLILWEAFETIILPRRVSRRFRLTRYFYVFTWMPWSAIARAVKNPKRRETMLGYFGPLSLLLLLVFWGAGLLVGFALLHWADGSALAAQDNRPPDFLTDLYMSATTFFTLGLGDVIPKSVFARVVTAVECATGFGFIAALIGYLPTIYQSFSRREANISLLDARAGSPPSASEILKRQAQSGDPATLTQLLVEWERWSADILESHISYPLLCYFRSQHDNQSWLASLTAILDVCALVIVGVEKVPAWQARLTFAMARHAMVDIAQVFGQKPSGTVLDRLPPQKLQELRASLEAEGVVVCNSPVLEKRLAELRGMYEPYVAKLSDLLLMELPDWLPRSGAKDSWKTAAGTSAH